MKKALYIFVFTIIASSALAQDNFSSWQYSMGFGTGSLHEYTSPVSFRGVTYNFHSMVTENITVGLEIGWNVFFEEKPYDTYTKNNFEYSGKQWRYSNNFPLLFNVGYYLNPNDDISPFAGLGIGTMYSERRTSFGTYDFIQDAWHFVLKPELGVMYNLDAVSLSVSSKYYYGFKTADLPAEGFFTINVGVIVRR